MREPKLNETERRQFDEAFDKQIPVAQLSMYELIKPYVKDKQVLDIGCWSGHYEQLLAKDVKNITGIDPGEEAINFARRRLSDHNNVSFKVSTAQSLEFKDNRFDVCLFLDVIEHLENGEEQIALQEIARVLRPGGILILSTPNSHPISVLLDPAYFLYSHRHYSFEVLNRMLNETGFNIIENKLLGGFAHLLSYNAEMIYKHLLKKSFTRPEWINRKIKKEFINSGFAGHFIIAEIT